MHSRHFAVDFLEFSFVSKAASWKLSCTFEKRKKRHRENAIAFSVNLIIKSPIGDSESAIGVSKCLIGNSECIV